MKKTNLKKTNMKKGITLIEIILAIVLIAIILGVTIPKLMSNSARAEIKTVITSDVKSIVESAGTWRKSSATAAGTYLKVSGANLDHTLPSNIVVTANKGLILSSGLKTGVAVDGSNASEGTGVVYYIFNDTGATSSDSAKDKSNEFSLYADFANGSNDLNWDAKTRGYAEDVFTDVIAEVTDNPNPVKNTAYSTAVGGVTFNCTAGNSNTAVCYTHLEVR